jgi:carbohydrate-selective porin OprB
MMPPKSQRLFTEVMTRTYADRRTSMLDDQIFWGLVQYGLGPWRPRDGYGIAVGTTHVNPNVANGQIWANALGVGPGFVQRNEYVTEAWYGWKPTPWLNLKLDAQYVICPPRYTTPTFSRGRVANGGLFGGATGLQASVRDPTSTDENRTDRMIVSPMASQECTT